MPHRLNAILLDSSSNEDPVTLGSGSITVDSTTHSIVLNNDGTVVDSKTDHSLLLSHTDSCSNPHLVDNTQVGLGNVTNDVQLKIASNLSDISDVTTAVNNLWLGPRDCTAYDAETSTTSGTYVNRIIHTTGTLSDGTYRVEWFNEWTSNATNKTCDQRYYYDSTDNIISELELTPSIAHPGYSNNSGCYAVVLGDGSHTIGVDYKTNGTAYMRRTRISVTRVPG